MNKTRLFLFLISISVTAISKAQFKDSAWAAGGVGTLAITQVSLTNWAAGGENSLSASAFFSGFLKYKKEKMAWDNSLDMGYGFLKSAKNPLRKNDDKIELNSKFGHVIANKLFITGLFNFKSQFDNGYNYPNDSVITSRFLAPGYMIVSTGFDYKPNDNLSFYISPLTGKSTFVMDEKLADAGAYGVEKATYDATGILLTHGKKLRQEFGAYFTMKYRQNIMENITLSTKLDLFSNYIKEPDQVDVNWDMLMAMKINKYISASIATTLIYDKDIAIPLYKEINGVDVKIGAGPRVQFKEVFALGLSYKF